MPLNFHINEDLLFLGMMASAIAIGAWGVAQVLIGLFGKGNVRLEERLAVDARRELQATDRRNLVRQQSEELPGVLADIFFLQQMATHVRQAFPGRSPVRFLAIVAAIALGAAIAVGSFRSPLAAAMAAGAVLFIAYLVVSMRCAHRQRVLADQLQDALDFMSRVLRAGHSLSTAFQMIGDELPDPIAGEFRTCYDQISLGQPIDKAMLDMAARIDNTDFAFFVTAVMIQRQTGGDLAGLLDNISGVIRNRIRLQQHAKALTAEGRFSGYLLTALPVCMFVFLYIANPGYVGVLFTTDLGRLMLAVGAGLVIFGQILMKKMVTIKV